MPLPLLRMMTTSSPSATARSVRPLPRKLPATIPPGSLPTGKAIVIAGWNVPSPLPMKIETQGSLFWKPSSQSKATSRLSSPLKSPTTMPTACSPELGSRSPAGGGGLKSPVAGTQMDAVCAHDVEDAVVREVTGGEGRTRGSNLAG